MRINKIRIGRLYVSNTDESIGARECIYMATDFEADDNACVVIKCKIVGECAYEDEEDFFPEMDYKYIYASELEEWLGGY